MLWVYCLRGLVQPIFCCCHQLGFARMVQPALIVDGIQEADANLFLEAFCSSKGFIGGKQLKKIDDKRTGSLAGNAFDVDALPFRMIEKTKTRPPCAGIIASVSCCSTISPMATSSGEKEIEAAGAISTVSF